MDRMKTPILVFELYSFYVCCFYGNLTTGGKLAGLLAAEIFEGEVLHDDVRRRSKTLLIHTAHVDWCAAKKAANVPTQIVVWSEDNKEIFEDKLLGSEVAFLVANVVDSEIADQAAVVEGRKNDIASSSLSANLRLSAVRGATCREGNGIVALHKLLEEDTELFQIGSVRKSSHEDISHFELVGRSGAHGTIDESFLDLNIVLVENEFDLISRSKRGKIDFLICCVFFLVLEKEIRVIRRRQIGVVNLPVVCLAAASRSSLGVLQLSRPVVKIHTLVGTVGDRQGWRRKNEIEELRILDPQVGAAAGGTTEIVSGHAQVVVDATRNISTSLVLFVVLDQRVDRIANEIILHLSAADFDKMSVLDRYHLLSWVVVALLRSAGGSLTGWLTRAVSTRRGCR